MPKWHKMETANLVNEEKLREEIALAIIDSKEEKTIENHRVFFRGDYISKEMLKSFFSGSILFLLFALLYLLADVDTLMDTINTIDYEAAALQFVTIYLAFIAIYFMVTYLVYAIRYTKQAKKVKRYRTHLKRLEKIYNRDERA